MSQGEKVRIVVYIEIGLYILGLVTIVGCLVFAAAFEEFLLKTFGEFLQKLFETFVSKNQDKEEVAKQIYVVVCIAFAVMMLISLILLIILFKGHRQRSAGKLRVWFVIGCIGVVIMTLGIISALAFNPRLFVILIPLIALTAYRTWALTCVNALIDDISAGPPGEPIPFDPIQFKSPGLELNNLGNTNV